MMLARLAVIPGFVVLALALGSSGIPAAAQERPKFPPDSTMAKLQTKANVLVGTKFDTPAVNIKNPITGKTEGFNIDMSYAIAKRMGVDPSKIEFSEVISANRETSLQEGLTDLNVSGYVITDKRRAEVGMAGPYIYTNLRLFVHKDNYNKFNTVEDIKGKTICHTPTGSGVPIIRRLGATFVPFDDIAVCMLQVANKQVDGVIIGDLLATGFFKQYPNLVVAKIAPFDRDGWGIGFKKGDAPLCKFLIGAIRDIIATGEWQKMWDSNFLPVGLPKDSPPTVQDHC